MESWHNKMNSASGQHRNLLFRLIAGQLCSGSHLVKLEHIEYKMCFRVNSELEYIPIELIIWQVIDQADHSYSLIDLSLHVETVRNWKAFL